MFDTELAGLNLFRWRTCQTALFRIGCRGTNSILGRSGIGQVTVCNNEAGTVPLRRERIFELTSLRGTCPVSLPFDRNKLFLFQTVFSLTSQMLSSGEWLFNAVAMLCLATARHPACTAYGVLTSHATSRSSHTSISSSPQSAQYFVHILYSTLSTLCTIIAVAAPPPLQIAAQPYSPGFS